MFFVFLSLPLDQTLPRQGPSQPLSFPENYQSLPKSTRHLSGSSSPPPRNLPSDYKYAQDRASHLKMSSEERRAHRDGTVWQLYEWQQRQQFRHGSPTAPIGAGSPEFTEQGRSRSLLEVPRSISVPPSPSDIPPPGPPRPFPPRRPHTPAERVTVKPPEQRRSVDISLGGSPRKARGHAAKVRPGNFYQVTGILHRETESLGGCLAACKSGNSMTTQLRLNSQGLSVCCAVPSEKGVHFRHQAPRAQRDGRTHGGQSW